MMQLEHSFTVPLDVDSTWAVLLDIERVAPCMPGATVTSVRGDEFSGTVKVKLGAISLTYKGDGRFVEKDEVARRTVIRANGRDSRGGGTAGADVTAHLIADGDQTRVVVTTELDITGKPAQFGRGVMADVGNKLIGQFAESLARQLTAPAAADSVTTASEAPPATTKATADAMQVATPVAPVSVGLPQNDDAIDLMRAAGPAVAMRLVPMVIAVVLALIGVRAAIKRR